MEIKLCDAAAISAEGIDISCALCLRACTKNQMNGVWPEAKVHLARCTRINHRKNRSLARPHSVTRSVERSIIYIYSIEQISLIPIMDLWPRSQQSQTLQDKDPGAARFKCVSRFRHHFYWLLAQMANQSLTIKQH